jgi:hypothetical protein
MSPQTYQEIGQLPNLPDASYRAGIASADSCPFARGGYPVSLSLAAATYKANNRAAFLLPTLLHFPHT